MIQQTRAQDQAHHRAPRPYQQGLQSQRVLFSSVDYRDSSMLSTRAAASTSSTANSARASTRRRSLPVPLPRLQSLSSPSMAIEPAQPKNPTPVIRWLGPLCTQAEHPAKRPPGSTSDSPSGSAPPSPCLSSLNEALNEDILPTTPPHARLPSSFYASRALSRPPPFLDNLTRSTLPTASLSSGLPLYRDTSTAHSVPLNDPQRPLAEVQRVSVSRPRSRSSMDTLRSVRDRNIHMMTPSVPSPTSTAPTNWWWFQGDNKQNVDTLLQEEDRADSVSEEQSNIRKKCEHSIPINMLNNAQHSASRPHPKEPNNLLPRPSRL
jgi:hypothetical protein